MTEGHIIKSVSDSSLSCGVELKYMTAKEEDILTNYLIFKAVLATLQSSFLIVDKDIKNRCIAAYFRIWKRL